MKELSEQEIQRVVGGIPSSDLVLFCPGLQGQGSTLIDRSQSANHGTISGAAWKGTLRGLKLLDFNGSTDYVTVADAPSIRNIFDGGGTVSVWLKPDTGRAENYQRAFCKKAAHKGIMAFLYAESSSKVKVWFYQGFDGGADGQWSTNATALSVGVWSKLTITYNNAATTNDPIVYVNGAVKAVGEMETPVGTRGSDSGIDLWLAREVGQDYFGGPMTFWQIETAIRSAAREALLYGRERHLFGV